jgi:hypothetical protein
MSFELSLADANVWHDGMVPGPRELNIPTLIHILVAVIVHSILVPFIDFLPSFLPMISAIRHQRSIVSRDCSSAPSLPRSVSQ